MIFDVEEKYASEHSDLEATIYLAAGEKEIPTHSGGPHNILGDQVELAHRLRARAYPSLVLKDEIIEGAVHETTFPIGFTRGVQRMFSNSESTTRGEEQSLQ